MGLSYSTRNTRQTIQDLTTSFPSWAHPDVLYSEEDWQILRDTYRGERFVKKAGQVHLKKPSGMTEEEYEMYLENATFFPMVSRTVGALVGTIFRRDPAFSQISDKLKAKLNTIGKRGESFRTFARRQARETILMARYGVLLDRPSVGKGDPYLVGYVAEAILDWKTESINGREQFTEVVLMEIEPAPNASASGRRFQPLLRVLRLVDTGKGYEYQQHVYHNASGEGTSGPNQSYPDITRPAKEIATPTLRGVPFDYIPFVMFSPDSATVETEQSPMTDIARMNLSHYRSYAQLEHGRFYTGNPIYWVTKSANSGDRDYYLGPSMVWELEPGQKAGLMEFNGNGLKFLENALSSKEAQAATLGGRFIGVTTQSVSESDNQSIMKDRNEQALLLTATLAMDEGWSKILGWWARWHDQPKAVAEEVQVRFNKDFLLASAAAREFRAIHAMYTDGILPLVVVYDYLRKADVIPDWLEMDEFKRMLEDESSFPNQPDAEARAEGFPDKKTQLDNESKEKDRDIAADQADQAAITALRTQQSVMNEE